MSKLLKILTVLVLSTFASVCFAIQVSVKSDSDGVYAVGFRVNGEKFGDAGKSYSHSGPAGAEYIFGMRIGGLIFDAEDIACTTVNGGFTSVKLDSDTNATLMYDGNKKCYVQVYPA